MYCSSVIHLTLLTSCVMRAFDIDDIVCRNSAFIMADLAFVPSFIFIDSMMAANWLGSCDKAVQVRRRIGVASGQSVSDRQRPSTRPSVRPSARPPVRSPVSKTLVGNMKLEHMYFEHINVMMMISYSALTIYVHSMYRPQNFGKHFTSQSPISELLPPNVDCGITKGLLRESTNC